MYLTPVFHFSEIRLTFVSYVFVLVGLNKNGLNLKDIEYFTSQINNLYEDGIISLEDFDMLKDSLNNIKH